MKETRTDSYKSRCHQWLMVALVLCVVQDATSNAATPRVIKDIHGSVAISPDGTTVATCGGRFSEDGTKTKVVESIKLFDLRTQRRIAAVEPPGSLYGVIYRVAFFPDGKTLLSSGYDATVRFWNVGKMHQIKKIEWPENSAGRIAISPDGNLVAMLGVMGGLRVWDVRRDKDCFTLPDRMDNSIAFSSDGRYLACGCPESGIVVWNTETWKLVAECRDVCPDDFLAFLPDKKALLALTDDDNDHKKLVRWDFDIGSNRTMFIVRAITKPTPPEKLPDGTYSPPGVSETTMLAFSPTKHLVAAATITNGNKPGANNERLRIWDVRTGTKLVDLTADEGKVGVMTAFSQDGQLLVTANHDSVFIWNVKELLQAECHAQQ